MTEHLPTSNTGSILERLRWCEVNSMQTANGSDIFKAAADEIERLDDTAVDLFAVAMKEKLAKKRHQTIMLWKRFTKPLAETVASEQK
jgi:hypothetical protein